MKKAVACLVALLIITLLAACQVRGRAPSTPTPRPTDYGPAVVKTSLPAGVPTVPPGKTASQDTVGAMTTIPEAATAAGASGKP